MDNNKAFQDYVTSTAFHLHLSRNMVSFLAYVHDYEELAQGSIKYEDQPDYCEIGRYINARGHSDHCTPANALLRRGLIYSPIKKWPGIYHLTDAGKLVFKLLKLAGLVESITYKRRVRNGG